MGLGHTSSVTCVLEPTRVVFDTPVGYTQTLPNEVCVGDPGDAKDSDCGSTDTCTTLTFNNPNDLTIDCGYVPECEGKIGDSAWVDTNENGCQDANELGLAGVKVKLYQGACGQPGILVRETTTDGTGAYLFSDLCPGTYTVVFDTPVGYTQTLPNQVCVGIRLMRMTVIAGVLTPAPRSLSTTLMISPSTAGMNRSASFLSIRLARFLRSHRRRTPAPSPSIQSP